MDLGLGRVLDDLRPHLLAEPIVDARARVVEGAPQRHSGYRTWTLDRLRDLADEQLKRVDCQTKAAGRATGGIEKCRTDEAMQARAWMGDFEASENECTGPPLGEITKPQSD